MDWLYLYWTEILTALGIILSMPLVSAGSKGVVKLILLSSPYIAKLLILIGKKIGWPKKKSSVEQATSEKQDGEKPQP